MSTLQKKSAKANLKSQEVVLFGFSSKSKVRNLHSFLVGDQDVTIPVDYLVVSEVLMLIHN